MLGLFGLTVLFLAVCAVRYTLALTWVAILLGLPVVFYPYTAYGLIRYMSNDNVFAPVRRSRWWLAVRLHPRGHPGHLAAVVQRLRERRPDPYLA